MGRIYTLILKCKSFSVEELNLAERKMQLKRQGKPGLEAAQKRGKQNHSMPLATGHSDPRQLIR